MSSGTFSLNLGVEQQVFLVITLPCLIKSDYDLSVESTLTDPHFVVPLHVLKFGGQTSFLHQHLKQHDKVTCA